MATREDLYYSNVDLHTYDVPSDHGEVRITNMSLAVPNTSQSITMKRQQSSRIRRIPIPISAPQHLRPEQHGYRVPYENTDRYQVTKEPTFQISECRPSSQSSPPRAETLKRRPSLREAARSFRTSKVAKRLRRHAKAELDPEDGDDAGASASESDNAAKLMYGNKTSELGQYGHDVPERPQSVVSNLVSDMQSSLSIETHGRDRGSSLASQTSSWVMDSSDSASTNTSFTTLSSMSNRSNALGSHDSFGDGEADIDRIGKRNSQNGTIDPEQPQLFACPFAKHDPKRYSAANLEELNYRGCSQSYLTDLARVKQHLYRVHERPQHHCPDCYETFKNQAQCMKHVALKSCSPRACPFSEKMTSEQLAAIKKKNRGTDPYLGWYEIYKTLFPGAQLPMSPYAAFTATADTLELFMEFVMRELPSRLRHQPELDNSMVNIVQELLPNVLRDIRRDFSPLLPSKPESASQEVENGSPGAGHQDTSEELNFHQMVTMEGVQNGQSRLGRPSIIDLPHPVIYSFSAASPPQIIAGVESPQTQLPPQHSQPDFGSHQPHQQILDYSMHDHGMMPAVSCAPLTAIYQPDERESQHGYFVGHHLTQHHLPTYTLQLENEGSWLPAMITTRMDYSIDHGVQGMMDTRFQGGFGNHMNHC